MTPADASPPDPRPALRPRLGRVVRVVGVLVAVVAVALCARSLAGSWSQVRTSLSDARPGWLAVALVCGAAAMSGLAVLWWRCLHAYGSPERLGSALAWYFAGELGKYLPGGVWTVLGRAELAHRGGRVSRMSALATTLISYGCMCLSAFTVCGVLAVVAAIGGAPAAWVAFALLVPVSVVLLHPGAMARVLSWLATVTRGRLAYPALPWSVMLRLAATAVPAWLLLGGLADAVTAGLGLHQQLARVAFAAVAAWIVGFLAVPVPAGVGVRELVFIGLCGLDTVPATTVAVLMRALLVIVDAAGGALGLGYAASRLRRLQPVRVR